MAYTDNFPQRPVFMADFANGGKIDPRATFSRASTANVWDGSKHLSSENLILQSQNFGTTWGASPTVGSRDASAGTGPDGSDSWLITAGTSGSSWPSLNQSFGFKASTQYTYSVYVKAGTATHAWFAARGNSSTAVTGTLNFSSPASIATTSAGGWTVNSSSVTAHGDWYRISLTFTTNSTVSSPFVYVGLSDGTAPATYYPTGTPNGETVYVWGAQVEERGSATDYNATTTQIHREYAPSLVSKANNAARFDHTTDGQSIAKGILIESQAQNLATYSGDFSNGAYGKFRATIESNSSIAPDGTLTADLLREDTTATNSHFIATGAAIGLSVGSSKFAVSVFAKAAGRTKLRMFDNNQVTSGDATFDLSNGTTNGFGTIEDCGNGWYRCTITPTCDNSSTASIYIMLNDGSGTTYTGNGYSGVLLWGFQIENGNGSGTSFSSSYIGTTSSAVTRAAESLSMTDASLFDNGGGTLYAEASQNVLDTYNGVFAVSDGTGANTIEILGNSSSFRGQVVNANSTNASFIGGTITVGQFNKHALTFSSSEASYYVNGSEIGTTDSSVVVPTVSEIDIGNVAWSRPLNGHIRKVALYSEPISETAAAALTS